MTVSEGERFWNSMVRALEAEPVGVKSFKGKSGLEHQMLAVGFDETRNRLVLVSNEFDPRMAALMEMDIGDTLPNEQKAIVARPVFYDFSTIVNGMISAIGASSVNVKVFGELTKDPEFTGNLYTPEAERMRQLMLMTAPELRPLMHQVMDQFMGAIFEQLEVLDLDRSDAKTKAFEAKTIDLSLLAKVDPIEKDRKLGTCALPFFSLSGDEIEAFLRGANLDDVREALSKHGVLQYFFPAADQTVVGLVDHGTSSPELLNEQISSVPDLGHPYGPNQLVARDTNLFDTVIALKEEGYLVEGDFGEEITSAGRQVRSRIKFSPSEGLFHKLLNRVWVKIDIRARLGILKADDSEDNGN